MTNLLRRAAATLAVGLLAAMGLVHCESDDTKFVDLPKTDAAADATTSDSASDTSSASDITASDGAMEAGNAGDTGAADAGSE